MIMKVTRLEIWRWFPVHRCAAVAVALTTKTAQWRRLIGRQTRPIMIVSDWWWREDVRFPHCLEKSNCHVFFRWWSMETEQRTRKQPSLSLSLSLSLPPLCPFSAPSIERRLSSVFSGMEIGSRQIWLPEQPMRTRTTTSVIDCHLLSNEDRPNERTGNLWKAYQSNRRWVRRDRWLRLYGNIHQPLGQFICVQGALNILCLFRTLYFLQILFPYVKACYVEKKKMLQGRFKRW